MLKRPVWTFKSCQFFKSRSFKVCSKLGRSNMDTLVRKIILGTGDEFFNDIATFQENFENRTTFDELNNEQLREKLWEALFRCLSDNSQSNEAECLATLRMLSRDKTRINELITDERINIILDKAALTDASLDRNTCNNIVVEAIKLLCNLTFNSTKVQETLPNTSCLPCLIERMRNYNNTTPQEIMLFDTRIVFLITALNKSTQRTVKIELKGDQCLLNMLNNIGLHCDQNGLNIIKGGDEMLACEVLKALFNLYINSADTSEEEEKHSDFEVLQKLLLCARDNKDNLLSNITNLLTVIPPVCYPTIIRDTEENHSQVFQNADMSAVYVLLKFLDRRLNCKDDLIGNICPIVTALTRMVKSERLIRKYARLMILPPLKDVMHRPEEGTTLRAKLCKLLTSPLTELRDLVAEFLFILCRENVNRMVKYTGYGNAAGMFANKGLLGSCKRKPVYSSESEDSETEEYLQQKEHVNPVTGCYEQTKSNPLEGMTEEQKEYEALQLLSLVDKLTRGGVVQPCRIGDDGKPQPIEHVLELQEELPKQQYGRRNSDSDSDSD